MNEDGNAHLIDKGMKPGTALSDADMARLFVEAAHSDGRINFYNAKFETADEPARVERLLLICLSNIGDVVGASIVFAGLREKHPCARIVFLTETPGGALVQRCPEIDRVIEYSRSEVSISPSEVPAPDTVEAACSLFIQLIDDLRSENFDAVFNLHASARSALIAGALDLPAPATIGYSIGRGGVQVMRGNIWMQARLLGEMPVTRMPEENNLRAIWLAPPERKLNVCLPKIEFPQTDLAATHGPAMGLNPFASVPGREWGEEKFTALGEIFIREMNRDVIVFAGPAQREREAARRICSALGPRTAPCIGAPPDQAASIAAGCELFVTNDTGPMHFAGAAGARCLVIMGPTNFLPYSALGHIGIAAALPCGGCGPEPECTDRKCYELIEPRQVAAIAEEMLTHAPHAALANLAGTLDDGKFPHGLITTGTYESLTPRYLMRLRSALPIESNIVSEWTKIAVLNIMLLMETGSLETGHHPLGTDHPGLAAPIAPETAVREVLKRHDFYKYGMDKIAHTLEETIELINAPVDKLQPQQILILLPILSLQIFLHKAGLETIRPHAKSLFRDFLATIFSQINLFL